MKALPQIMSQATASIEASYFKLPIYGKKTPIFRERVYCYELYHQLRSIWPSHEYILNGEVDKSGHGKIKGDNITNTKPDFLIHTPGDMAGNFAVIEVKPINAKTKGITKDLKTLTAYLNEPANYQIGILLFYGDIEPERLLKKIHRIAKKFPRQIDLTRIVLLHHRFVGQPVEELHLSLKAA